MTSVQILQGDCIDVLRTLPPSSVDAVVTDPPYGIAYQSDHRSRAFAKIANDEAPFVWWLPEAFRVLKDGAGLVCFCHPRTQEAFRLAIEWAGFNVRSHVIWDREWHGAGDLKGSFGPRHDCIWFASKGKFQFPGKRPVSVLRSRRIDGASLTHPNEKPIDLMRQLIEAVTPAGGTVLDPFAGSGSTLVAALDLGRPSIGIELSPAYVAAIQSRLGVHEIPEAA